MSSQSPKTITVTIVTPSFQSLVKFGGVVPQLVECRTWFESHYTTSELGQFRLPHFASVFRKRH